MTLRIIRRILASAVFVLLTFFFIDFAGLLPEKFHVLAHMQFVPAVLSLSFGILAVLLLLTLLFGRVYCSVICPAGIFQDIAGRCGRLFRKKQKRFKYSRQRTVLRWVVAGAVTLAAGFGFILVLSLLDPYSMYGRIAANIFRPLYLLGNNLLAYIFTSQGNYTFYYMDAGIVSISAFIVAVVSFLAIGYMGWRHGRTYCNTICPVGTVLGLFGRFSVWKVRIDSSKCTSCGVCAGKCKASCIDAKGKSVDGSRCVACYNCLGSCKFDALSYSPPKKRLSDAAVENTGETDRKTGVLPGNRTKNAAAQTDESRRRFLAASAAALAVIPRLKAEETINGLAIQGTSRIPYKRDKPIAPPGAGSIGNLQKKCTSCHLCVSKCPVHIIKPSYTEYGVAGFMMPTVSYEKGFCSYDCTVCSNVCPNGALTPLTVEEKNITQVGRVVLIEDNCVVHTEGTNCGACSEHCPTQAVKMVPFRDGLTKPQTDPEICVGCGGCEFICPVRPFRAIYVDGNTEHRHRQAFEETEKTEFDFDGFGF